MRVYLDNCCYNRPFDDQMQLRIRLETEAKLEIQSRMRLGILEYVWSDMLIGEGSSNWRNARGESDGIHSGGRMMAKLTDRELQIRGFMVLVQTLGDVDAERFIALTNREPMDYTRWREENMYLGESVHEVAERAQTAAARYFASKGNEQVLVR